MKYAFIQRHKRVWPIRVQCRVLRVSVSGYHQHLVRLREIAQRRHLSDEALLVHISAVYGENRGAYGWPRIWRQLDVYKRQAWEWLSRPCTTGSRRIERER